MKLEAALNGASDASRELDMPASPCEILMLRQVKQRVDGQVATALHLGRPESKAQLYHHRGMRKL
jgi:hypothetical protein